MASLHIQSVKTHLQDDDGSGQYLDRQLRVQTPGSAMLSGSDPDGFYHLFRGEHLPTGLLSYIKRCYTRDGAALPAIVDDRGPMPTIHWERHVHGLELRPYQNTATETVLRNTLELGSETLPWPRGVIQISMAGGKAVSADLAVKIEGQVLVLVHRVELLTQTVEVLRNLLRERIGAIGGGQ